MSIKRRDFLKGAAVASAAAGILSMSRKAPAQTGKFPKKVIILGFDGASPVFVEKWMDAGLLPNLARLRSQGSYSRIMTANPPQTPVSWAAFATGLNPGKTSLFDFLRRDPHDPDYVPTLALVDEGETDFLAGAKNPLAFGAGAFVVGGVAGLVVNALYNVIRRRENPEVLTKMFDPKILAAVAGIGALAGAGGYGFAKEYLPDKMPTVKNGVRGRTFWQYLDERSIPTLSVRVPARFPADQLKNGRAIAGLGVPDIRGTMGTFSYYTTELLSAQESGDTEMGGKVVPLYFKPTTQEARTVVYGPSNKLFPDRGPADITVDLKLSLKPDSLVLETPDWTETLRVGQWSKPKMFSFRFNKFISIEGFAKFYLLELSPDVKLYLQPISFHPKTRVVASGPVRISTPPSFIGDMYDKYGAVKTLGWAADTWALNELRISEEVFLEDLREYVGQYRQWMMEFLASDEPLFVQVYSFTDRIAHMFWHHIDEKHPLYDPAKAEKYSKVILEAYQLMDSIVGDALKTLDDNKWLFVLSDHGFHSFRYAFNYNTWLAQNGFIASQAGSAVGGGKVMKLDDLFGRGQFWPNVDWTRTKAYSLGLGGIYVNLAGREAHGIVTENQYEGVRDAVIKGLEAYVDPTTGQRPVFKVYRREQAYSGYDPNDMPDLRAANDEGYRCSWQSSLGGFPTRVVDINSRKWSGDHCSFEPTITKGIFFCSHNIPGKDPNLLDFFPTVLSLFGYNAPAEVDGKDLLKV